MASAIMKFFRYEHLKDVRTREISSESAKLAALMDEVLPDCAEKSAGLRKLLEAKDCFVRAALPD
jgi:hypothetical protein